jgi:hypothetical protein
MRIGTIDVDALLMGKRAIGSSALLTFDPNVRMSPSNVRIELVVQWQESLARCDITNHVAPPHLLVSNRRSIKCAVVMGTI